MKKVIAAALLAAAFMLPAAVAQTTDGNGGFQITEVRYHVEGITREWALQQVVEDLHEGAMFNSREELAAFMADQQQLLVNQRTLQTVRVEYEVVPHSGTPDGVVVDVFTKDTWNIIVLPYVKYDSNNGLLLSLRGRDYNFFGTMQEFRINLDYEYDDTENNSTWAVDYRFNLPFNWGAHRWNWGLDHDYSYNPDYGWETTVGTSLGITLPIYLWDWNLTYRQAIYAGNRTDEPDDRYLTSKLSFGTAIPTGLGLGFLGEVEYKPTTYTSVNYWPGRTLSDDNRGGTVGFDHSLEAGRVDWIGNFRKGATASISNDNAYNVTQLSWDRNINAEIAGYIPAEPFAFSARLSGMYKFDEIEDEAAGEVRGILNNRMEGDMAAYWNSDITLRVFTIPRFVEGQGSVFFDAALVTTRGVSFDMDRDFKYAGGIEAIGFPLFARSLYMRASLGFDLREVIKTKSFRSGYKREIFIGLGHFY